MEGLKEITGIADGFRYPEHIYFLNKAGKLVSYIKEGTTELYTFKKPMAFYTARRKFEKVNYEV